MAEIRPRRVAVMIHGGGDNRNVWSVVGDEVTKSGVEWVAIDLPGRNDQMEHHPQSIEGLADWVAAAIANQDLRDIVLVGHSMGSLVALEVVGRIPTRVAKLVLLCAGTPMAVSDALLEAESMELLQARITKWSHSRNAEMNHAEAMDHHVAQYATLHGDTFVFDLRCCDEYRGAVAAARKVDVPTTVVLAELDMMVPTQLADPIIEALGTSTVVILEGAGHAIADEAPIETARIIVDVATAS